MPLKEVGSSGREAGGEGGQKAHHFLIPSFITHFIHPEQLINFLPPQIKKCISSSELTDSAGLWCLSPALKGKMISVF